MQYQISRRAGQFKSFFLGLMLAAPLGLVARDFQVTLQWDANIETNLAGYRVYIGTQSDQYSAALEAGLETRKEIQGLEPGRTYFFAVTACTSNAQESPLSAEVSYTVPIDGTNAWLVPLNLTFSGALARITYMAGYGQRYFVQASTDLVSWRTVHTTPNWMPGPAEWLDQDTPNQPKRFYRVVGAWPL